MAVDKARLENPILHPSYEVPGRHFVIHVVKMDEVEAE